MKAQKIHISILVMACLIAILVICNTLIITNNNVAQATTDNRLV